MNRIDRRSTLRRGAAGVVAVGLAVTAAALAFSPGVSGASSHREAPLTATDPDIDNTDTYGFVSPDKPDTVTLITNVKPFQLPAGGPNFDPFPNGSDVRYNIKVDTDGNAKPDLTYRFTFAGGFKDKNTFLYNTGPVTSLADATLNFQQTYTVELIRASGKSTTLVKNAKVAPANVGKASMPDYGKLREEALATAQGADGTQTFAGPADDPFFLDIRVFDLLYGGDLSETGNPTLSGLNVSSLAVQVPTKVLTAAAGADKSGVIGIYATTERKSISVKADGSRASTGAWVQVSRLGSPLVNEVVSSVKLKDAFNNLPPEKDATVAPLVARVMDPEVPKLIEKIYKIPAPAAPRKDLFSVFLTGVKGLNQPTKVTPSEMLRLNYKTPLTTTPNRLGVLAGDNGGFPNGRRLTDDVVDIELQALEGALQPDGSVKLVEALKTGDKVDANDVPFLSAFPYLALPHSGSNPGTGGTGSGRGASADPGASNAAAPTGSPKAGFGGSASTLPYFGAAAALAGVLVLALTFGPRTARRRGETLTR